MKKKEQIYLILTGLLLIILAFVFLLILPLFREVKSSAQALKNQQESLAQLNQQFTGLADLKKDYLSFEEPLTRIEGLFVDPEAPLRFIEFLEGEAQKLGLLLEISSLTLQPSETDVWQPLGFQVSVSGPFLGCLQFLEKLELSSWLLHLEALSINRFSEKEVRYRKIAEGLQEGDVSLSVSLKVFAKK